MTSRLLRTLAVGTAALLTSAAVHAAVLFSQAPLDGGSALAGVASGSDFSGAQNADDFSLASGSTVTGFQWWGTTDNDAPAFVVRLFSDPLADSFDTLSGTVAKTATSLKDSANNDIFVYELTLTAPLALGGTRYLSVLFDSADPFAWFWLESDPNPISYFRGVDGDTWDSLPPDLAFAVLGEPATVDEPAVALLLFVAALGVVAQSRRRRAR
jgi:hypothetical protein